MIGNYPEEQEVAYADEPRLARGTAVKREKAAIEDEQFNLDSSLDELMMTIQTLTEKLEPVLAQETEQAEKDGHPGRPYAGSSRVYSRIFDATNRVQSFRIQLARLSSKIEL